MAVIAKEVLVVKKELKTSKNGNPYCMLVYREKGGKEDTLRIFNDHQKIYESIDEKKLYSIITDWEAQYPSIHRCQNVFGEMRPYVTYLFESTNHAMKILDDLLALITDEDLKELNNRIFTDEKRSQFIVSPAAISHHHCECGGLLQHTKEVMEFILNLSKSNLYPMIDYQIALEGALLHDICKIDEYNYGLLQATEVTAAYHLGGHLSMGAELVASYSQGLDKAKIENVKHIIRSHHYKKEWGAVVEPVTLEAILVYLADTWSANVNKFINCDFNSETGIGVVGKENFVKLT